MKTFRFLSFVIIALITIIICSKSTAQNLCKEVVGYYPGWQWYDRGKLVNPETIDYSKYSIINYAFLYPNADGSIAITDPWGDKNLLLGTINWSVSPAGYDSQYDLGNPAYHNPNTSLIYHAHQNNTPVLISLGGWTLSNDFPGVAADPVKRSNFAHWCNKLIRTYHIDGIDIDWEYPGFAEHNGTPADKENFTLLIKEVRDSLDAIENEMGKELMLTAAFSADPAKMESIEWDEIVPEMDLINLMSYDLFGAFSDATNHNSPLYAPAQGEPTFNCDHAVQKLLNDYNVPSEKITLGVAFYGRSAKTNDPIGLHVGPITGADIQTFAADEGTPLYYNIEAVMSQFDYYWDEQAQVPYLLNPSTNTFVSYDDTTSIRLKGEYIVNEQLGGAIIWEITGDYMETSPGSGIIAGTPLADALATALCSEPSTQSILENNISFSVYPNPFNNSISVQTNVSQFQTTITNMAGKVVYKSENQHNISTQNLPIGMYLLQIDASGEIQTQKIIKQ